MYQNNKNSILLAENSRLLALYRSKYINVKYLFIKNIINVGQLKIKYCPTDEILANY